MKTIIPLFALLCIALSQFQCNPNCRSLENLHLSTQDVPDGYEIAIRATPMHALLDRVITIGGVRVDPSGYDENYGLAFKVPAGLSGKQVVRIEDPDCLDFYELDLNVVTLNDYASLENFVPPLPPTIIFPAAPPVYPGTINNAWLSPENPAYCLWFTMLKKEVNGDSVSTNIIDPSNSFEQATCACLRDSDLPYAQNFMSGYIDTVGSNNVVRIYVHRSNGTEEYRGMFIDLDKAGYTNNLGLLNCPPTPMPSCAVQDAAIPGSGHMILLTSQKTGKQLLAYQVHP